MVNNTIVSGPFVWRIRRQKAFFFYPKPPPGAKKELHINSTLCLLLSVFRHEKKHGHKPLGI